MACAKNNPAFLPKGLFDRYDIRDGGEKLATAQTLSGAKSLIKKWGKKRPCSALSIYSQKFSKTVQSFKPSNGKEPQIDRDNSREYANQAKTQVASAKRYRLYLDGQEFATYDTKQEAEREGKKEGGRIRIKEVTENPDTAATPAAHRYQIHVNGRLSASHSDKAAADRAYGRFVASRPEDSVSLSDAHIKQVLKQTMNNPSKLRVLTISTDMYLSIDLRGPMVRVHRDAPVIRVVKKSGSGKKERWLIESVTREGQEAYGWIDKSDTEPYDEDRHQRNPRDRSQSGRRNPDNSSGASDLFEQFHGAPATGETIYEDSYEVPDAYAKLGDLVELWVIPIHAKNGKAVKITAADPDNAAISDIVTLCSSPDGRQLYMIGGDQEIDIAALGFSESEERHNMLIGVLVELTYRARKGFHKFKLTDYYHQLGEENGNEPVLAYDPYNCKLAVIGGDYHVKPEGIVN